jgi:hypothetical protein
MPEPFPFQRVIDIDGGDPVTVRVDGATVVILWHGEPDDARTVSPTEAIRLALALSQAGETAKLRALAEAVRTANQEADQHLDEMEGGA